MKLRDLFVEFKVNNEPRDEKHYRQMKKDLQVIQNDPKQRDPETKRAVMKRKAELDAWAHSKGIKSQESIEEGHYPHIKSFDKLYGINDVQKYKDMADDAQSMDMEEFVDTYNNVIDMAGDFWEDHQKKVAEEPVSMQDLKRVGADVKKVYVHKDGKTILVPVEKKDEYLAKGYKLSSLRAEDQVDERMPASIIKHKEKLANMSDKDLADRFKDFDDTRLRQMAWRHGYGKMSDYYVNRKNKGMSQDTNEGAMRMDKSAFVQMLANKIQEPQKGQGKPEYDNRLLAKMYKLITGRNVDIDGDKFTITMNKPTTEDLDYRSEDILNKAGFDPADIDTYMKVFNDHGDTSDIKQMNMKEKVGLADAMSIVLASHGISNESVNEGTYLDEGWLDTLKAAGRKIVPDQVKALYDPATAAKVQADDQAKVQMQTLFKDINTVVGLNQTDVSQGYPADLVVAYLRKYVAPKHPDAFKRMDAQGDLKKMFAPGSKISAGTLKGNLNKVAVELGKVNLSPDQEPTQQIGQQPEPVAASIDNEDSVKEGASMIPYFKTEKELDGEKTTVFEFPMAWAKDKELDTPYLSNASMRQFLSALGYPADFEDMSAVPIDEFIGVSTQWLKKNIGKPSPEEPTTVDKNPDGPTMISGGKPEGYMNQQVKLHNELARKIKSKYPEVTHLGFN